MDYSCQDIPMWLGINHQPLNFDIYLSQVIDVPRTQSLEVPPYDFKLELEALERVDRLIERGRLDEEQKQAVRNKRNSEQQIINNRNLQELLEQDNPPYYNNTISVPVTVGSTIHLTSATDNSQMQEEEETIQKQQQQESSVLNPTVVGFPIYSLEAGSSSTNTASLPPPTCPTEIVSTQSKCYFEQPSSSTMHDNLSPAADSNDINKMTATEATLTTATTASTTNCDSAKSSDRQIGTCGTKSSQSSDNSSNKQEPKVNYINPREFEELHYDPFDHLELQTIDELRELNLVFQASFANQASKQ